MSYDLWRAQDLLANSPEAALANAGAEGVEKRVRIETGDACQLPRGDESADVVVSHWVIHNIEHEDQRERALSDMWRILRPSGLLLVADIQLVGGYRDYFVGLGAARTEFLDGGWGTKAMGVLSGGTYKPQAVTCLKD